MEEGQSPPDLTPKRQSRSQYRSWGRLEPPSKTAYVLCCAVPRGARAQITGTMRQGSEMVYVFARCIFFFFHFRWCCGTVCAAYPRPSLGYRWWRRKRRLLALVARGFFFGGKGVHAVRYVWVCLVFFWGVRAFSRRCETNAFLVAFGCFLSIGEGEMG